MGSNIFLICTDPVRSQQTMIQHHHVEGVAVIDTCPPPRTSYLRCIKHLFGQVADYYKIM